MLGCQSWVHALPWADVTNVSGDAGSMPGGGEGPAGDRRAKGAVGLELLDVVELIARGVVGEQRTSFLVRDQVGRRGLVFDRAPS